MRVEAFFASPETPLLLISLDAASFFSVDPRQVNFVAERSKPITEWVYPTRLEESPFEPRRQPGNSISSYRPSSL